MKKIKVVIVEDSKTMSEWLAHLLQRDPEIEIVGRALDPFMARDIIKQTNPDVITLDIIMPKMDGITFLKNLMRLHPLPVVMVSSLTDKGSVVALEALALGALDYLPKPSQHEFENENEYGKKLIEAVKNASAAKVGRLVKSTLADRQIEHIIYHSTFLRDNLIVIGSSTGGIEALEFILSQLPKTLPAILVVQHLRQEFSASFAKRMSKVLRMQVKQAENEEEITPGCVYIAPGGIHLIVKRPKKRFYCCLQDSPPMHGHKPSVDVLFKSAAEVAGENVLGVLLTGMGDDGAEGAKAIHQIGGKVIVQDKETSVIWGMPGAAVHLNAADLIVPLNDIPTIILQELDAMARKQQF